MKPSFELFRNPMGGLWTTFTAPSGEKYYYNLRTKESTWKRPESFYEDGGNKRPKLTREPEPFYAIPLVNDWFLVIDDIGGKYYFDSSTEEASWTLEDPESAELLSTIDKNKIILLVAIARGYNTNVGDRVYQEVIDDLKALRKGSAVEEEGEQEGEQESESIPSESEEEEKRPSGLIAGYSSSEEEENEIDSDVEKLNNLGDDDLPKENHEDESQMRNDFFQLLQRHQCDPYSTWSIQARKIQEDPLFYRITDDSIRESMFEEWCEKAINRTTNPQDLVDEDNLDDDSREEEEEDELEPLPFHYLAHIVSKANITPSTIFQDIKDQNKADFKKYKIKQFVKSKSQQETFVSKLLFYYKKFTLDERKEIFHDLLESHSRSIKKNLEQESESMRSTLSEEAGSNDAYAIETKLLKMENLIGLARDMEELANDPKYYVLGIKDKMIELMHYLTSYI